MLTPNFYKEISPLTTQQTRQSTKSSLSRTFIQRSCPDCIRSSCLFFISHSIFCRISKRSFIFSRTLCSIMNFYMLSAVFGIFIQCEVESTAIVLIPNSAKLNFDRSASSSPADESLILSRGTNERSHSLHHVVV